MLRQSQAFWLLYYIITGPSCCLSFSESSLFMKLENDNVICDSDLLQLIPMSYNNAECALACQLEPNCTSFMFSPCKVCSPGLDIGTCSQCPSYNFTDVNPHPDTEVWLHSLGYVASPPNDVFVTIPRALSAGRFMVVRGRVPDPAPSFIIVSCLDNTANENYAVYIELCFSCSSASTANRVLLWNRIDSQWRYETLPEGVFPFAAGQEFQVEILAANDGFRVYVDGAFLGSITRSASLVGAVELLFLRDADFYSVMFN
ncbi:galectin [Plakobranchus ocellatus]|uniref:Galectin n=1 Tax=Plakobranchus ocellatus TaxID=259542 RepID=A0AAV3ZQ82_9GAST|nr:galectin [Plakobranchus ocellatus]